MRQQQIDAEVGPWSLTTSRAFWEVFTPAALPTQDNQQQRLDTHLRVEADWSRAEASVTQHHGAARIAVSGGGDLDAAAAQVRRLLSLDVDAHGWPGVADCDPVLADAQEQSARLAAMVLPLAVRGCDLSGAVPARAYRAGSPAAPGTHRPPRRRRRLSCPAGAARAPSWTCLAARASTCMPSPTPPWRAGWTALPCERSNPKRQSAPCKTSKGSARSPPNSSFPVWARLSRPFCLREQEGWS